MKEDTFMEVFVAKGYYDLATPFFATDYTFDHLGLDPSLRNHLSGAYYESGHMVFAHMRSLAKLKQDAAQFIRASSGISPGKARASLNFSLAFAWRWSGARLWGRLGCPAAGRWMYPGSPR